MPQSASGKFIDRNACRQRAKDVLRNNWFYLLTVGLIAWLVQCRFFSANVLMDVNTDNLQSVVSGLEITLFNIPVVTYSNAQFDLHASQIQILFVVMELIRPMVGNVAVYGMKAAHYSAANGQRTSVFIGFHNYWRIVWLHLRMEAEVILFSLLLIVPGIFRHYSYLMADYIAFEHPEYSVSQVLAASRRLTRTPMKRELLALDLSFLGWFILVVILDSYTFGLALVLLYPYYYQTQAQCYRSIRYRGQEPDTQIQ